MNRLFILLTILFLLPVVSYQGLHAKGNKFVLMLDPGHGGEDSGAVGYNKTKESDINLAVALLAGDMIKKAHPDVEVVYTRTKDTTLSLPKRAIKVNDSKADLLISIHANAAHKSSKNRKNIKGAEVFVFGKSTSKENMEVIRRENEIVFLEDEFKGIALDDILNSVEQDIIYDAIKQNHHKQSYELAKAIQDNLVSKAKRGNRGVKSGNLLMLRATGMPGVLIELDFISCPEAENYMTSKQGQKTMAECIANAFAGYKKQHDILAKNKTGEVNPKPADSGNKKKEEKKTTKDKSSNGEIVYKVQIYSSATPATAAQLKGHKADHYIENNRYKYTIGESSDWNEIQRIRESLQKDFKDAFIVKFKNGERIYN